MPVLPSIRPSQHRWLQCSVSYILCTTTHPYSRNMAGRMELWAACCCCPRPSEFGKTHFISPGRVKKFKMNHYVLGVYYTDSSNESCNFLPITYRREGWHLEYTQTDRHTYITKETGHQKNSNSPNKDGYRNKWSSQKMIHKWLIIIFLKMFNLHSHQGSTN